jgi:hypothetical protein
MPPVETSSYSAPRVNKPNESARGAAPEITLAMSSSVASSAELSVAGVHVSGSSTLLMAISCAPANEKFVTAAIRCPANAPM